MSAQNNQSKFARTGLLAVVMLAQSFTASVSFGETTPTPTLAATIDKSKCSDIENSQRLLKEEIVKRVREAGKAGARPATIFEGRQASGSASAKADQRASQQGERLSKSLFAAIKNPTNSIGAASEALTGNPNRRAAFQMYASCSGQVPRKVVENSTYFTGGETCKSGGISDVGINTQQIWQTDFSMEKVKTRFARAKVTSSEDNAVGICHGTRTACAIEGAHYNPVRAEEFNPVDNKEYYFQDRTEFDAGLIVYKPWMANRTVTKVSPIEVCGAKVYLVTAVNNGNNSGFDTSTLLGLIASVGGKTLVIGDGSAQAMTKPGEMADVQKLPLYFAKDDKVERTITAVLGTGYAKIGDVIGASERPVMGEIGGYPYPQQARPGEAASARRGSTVQ